MRGESAKASLVKGGFCIAVATLAASIASVVVESASNAGWFGAGDYTDHSYRDLPPALISVMFFLGAYVVVRLRAELSCSDAAIDAVRIVRGALSHNLLRAMPVIFPIQIAMLYAMESLEQRVVYGHVLGGTIWLGGPSVVALGLHMLICAVAVLVVSTAVRSITDAAANIIRRIRELVLVTPRDARPVFYRENPTAVGHLPTPILCRIGERAPPLLTA